MIAGARKITEAGRSGDDRDKRQRDNVQKRVDEERLQ